MEPKKKKRLSASIRFDFSGTTKLQRAMNYFQLLVVAALVVGQVYVIVTYGATTFSVLLLILWLAGLYFIISGLYKAKHPEAAQKAKESGIPELNLVTPVPEAEKESKTAESSSKINADEDGAK